MLSTLPLGLGEGRSSLLPKRAALLEYRIKLLMYDQSSQT